MWLLRVHEGELQLYEEVMCWTRMHSLSCWALEVENLKQLDSSFCSNTISFEVQFPELTSKR